MWHPSQLPSCIRPIGPHGWKRQSLWTASASRARLPERHRRPGSLLARFSYTPGFSNLQHGRPRALDDWGRRALAVLGTATTWASSRLFPFPSLALRVLCQYVPLVWSGSHGLASRYLTFLFVLACCRGLMWLLVAVDLPLIVAVALCSVLLLVV